MQIPVLIEPVNSSGFRATIGQPLAMTAEGETREQALGQLRHALQQRLSAGAEIAPFDLVATEHPLAPYAGMFKDNPLFDAWQEAIADNRQADEASEGL
jgi:hypothetical protein